MKLSVKQMRLMSIISVWACIALLMALQLYLRFSYEGAQPSFISLLLIQILAWSVWVLFTPTIIQLSKRFRISKESWKKGLFFHLPFSVGFVLLFLICYVSIFLIINQIAFSYTNFKSFYLTFYFQIFQWCWLIYWAVLGISYAVEYNEKFRDRELKNVQLEKDLGLAQLQALRMQLQPHFLFNTLHTIGAKVRLDEKQSAVQMLSLLSDLLRKVLHESDQQLNTVAQELDFLKEYLKLEQIRFENRLEIIFEVEDVLLSKSVPSMILQPLIENAIKHGFSKKLDARLLKVSILQHADTLELLVYNDGPSLNSFHPKQGGIGLENIRKRLHRLYGAKGTLHIQNEATGVLARIKIPLNDDA